MSAIGDYIHLYPSYYLRYGINRPDSKENFLNPSWSYDTTTKHRYMAQAISSSIMKANVKNISDIEDLIQSVWQPSKSNNSTAGKIREKIEKLLEQEFGELAGHITNTGNVVWTQEQEQKIAAANIQKIAKINLATKTGQNEISNVVGKIQKALTQLQKLTSLGLIGDASDLTALANDIRKQVNSLAQKNNWGDLDSIAPKELTGRFAFDKTFLSKVNELIAGVSLSKALSLQKGFMFEYVVAAAIAIMNHTAEDIIDDEIVKIILENNTFNKAFEGVFVTGDTKSIRQLDKEKFNPKIWDAMLGLDNGKFGHELTTQIKASQNKVDILINIEEGMDTISAKNYNLKGAAFRGGVKLVSGASLLRFLQDEDSNLVNHYLNIIGQHGKNQQTLQAERRDFIKDVREQIETVIAFKSLLGDQTNILNKANWFILNDNATGTVKLIPMDALFAKIITGSNYQDKIKIRVGGQELSKLTLKQNRVAGAPSMESAEQRIAKFLQQVHQQKIMASIPAEAFKAFGFKV